MSTAAPFSPSLSEYVQRHRVDEEHLTGMSALTNPEAYDILVSCSKKTCSCMFALVREFSKSYQKCMRLLCCTQHATLAAVISVPNARLCFEEIECFQAQYCCP
eukprot:6466722-Amphidinium_carterae.1